MARRCSRRNDQAQLERTAMRISTSRFLLISSLSLSLSAVRTQAAVYQEIGGQVVVEAEHFDSRATDTADNQHHWHVVPDDDNIDFLMDSPDTYGSTIFVNARGGKYVTPFPDAPGGGQNNNSPDLMTTATHIDYKVQITRTGEYRLFL